MTVLERVQFAVSASDGDHVFDSWAGQSHPQWPQLGAKSTTWSRFALRVLHAHSQRPEGVEWRIAKGGRLGKPLQVLESRGSAALKVDVKLSEADRARVLALERSGLADSPAAVLRTAVHFVAELASRLTRQAELVASSAGEPTGRPIDLAALMLESGPPAVEAGFILPVQGEPATAATISDLPGRIASNDADALFALLWIVTSFNRWLATKVDAVTRCAQETIRGDAPAAAERWQQELDIRQLLDAFWRETEPSLRSGSPNVLASELRESRLLPEAWKRSLGDLHACASRALQNVRAFLDSRFENLDRRASARSPRVLWRNWTRSRDTPDGYREIAAPLEWTAVAHHWLCHRPGGTPALVAHDLQTILTDAFDVRNSRHFPDLAAACARFNHAFHGESVISGDRALETSDRLFPLTALLELLAEPESTPLLRDRSDEERWDIARLTYLFLGVARIVRPVYRWKLDPGRQVIAYDQIERGVRALAYADLSELRARVFGAQTTLTGLHAILHGGIVPRANRGRVWLVTGKAGSGKSTFSLALAADMARRGRTAIVLCSDERAETVEERLIAFGLRDEARYDVITREAWTALLATEHGESESSSGSGESPPVKGLLVVYGAARPDGAEREPFEQLELSEWLRAVSQQTRELSRRLGRAQLAATAPEQAGRLRRLQRRWRWVSLVVDSLDALEVERPALWGPTNGPRDERGLMAALVREIEASRFWGILLCGADNPRTLPLSYLADTVIELSSDGTGLRRRLQIHKCRTQTFDPGLHVMELVEGAGVGLHPNLASMQRMARRRARRQLDSEHVVRLPDRVLWPGSLESTAPVTGRPAALPQIRRGSSVLFYGAPQTGKGPLLLNLVSQRLQLARYPGWRLGATGAVLFMSFRSSAQDWLRPLEECAALGERWASNVSEVQLQWFGTDQTLQAAQITHELLRRIQRSRRDGLPLDWIAFLGIEALKTNLPAAFEEPSFWPTILAITSNEEISTAFVVAGDTNEFVKQHEQDMDYVLHFARDEQRQRTVELQKSPDAPPPGGYPKLVLDLRAGTLAPR